MTQEDLDFFEWDADAAMVHTEEEGVIQVRMGDTLMGRHVEDEDGYRVEFVRRISRTLH